MGNGYVDSTETCRKLLQPYKYIRPWVDLLSILYRYQGGIALNRLRPGCMVKGRIYNVAATSRDGVAPCGPNSFSMKLATGLEKSPAKGFTVGELYSHMKIRGLEADLMAPPSRTDLPSGIFYPGEEFVVKPRNITPPRCLELRGELLGSIGNCRFISYTIQNQKPGI